MKDFLRKCYQTAGITGANARLYENRVTTIQEILEIEDFFTDEEWVLLTKWAIGAADNDSVEKQMIALEEAFCKTDSEYSKENEEELHILVGLLLYQYCDRAANLLLPSIIVCGHGVGWRLKCQLLYEKFLTFTDEARLNLRKLDQDLFPDIANMPVSLQTLKNKIEAKAAEKAQANGNAPAGAAQSAAAANAAVANELAALKKGIRTLSLQNQFLAFALSVQREESDILWWMLAEWSETCQRPYQDMTGYEAALFSAYELGSISLLPLGPYASKQILMKMISLGKTSKGQEHTSAAALIDHLNGDTLPSFEGCQITELQPILSALNAKRKAAQKRKNGEWRQYYDMVCETDLNTIQMSAVDFGRQIYLEIELGRQIQAKGGDK